MSTSNPARRTITALCLFVGSVSTNAAGLESVWVGDLIKISVDRIELKLGRGLGTLSVRIGEVDVGAQPKIDQVRPGDEVRVVVRWVTTLKPGMWQLFDIRQCKSDDEQCSSDRKKYEDNEEKRRTVITTGVQEQTLCRKAMEQTLASDPRYVPNSGTRVPVSTSVRDRFKALSAPQQECTTGFIRTHQNAFYEACQLHQCGDNIGGGCAHMVPNSVTTAVLEKALEKCE
jgi:hypothetical protein